MKYYTSTTEFNCGIHRHARQMYVSLMDRQGKIRVHTSIKNNDFAYFLKLIAPYRHDLTVACKGIFGWHWLADACQAAGLTFVLAHNRTPIKLTRRNRRDLNEIHCPTIGRMSVWSRLAVANSTIAVITSSTDQPGEESGQATGPGIEGTSLRALFKSLPNGRDNRRNVNPSKTHVMPATIPSVRSLELNRSISALPT